MRTMHKIYRQRAPLSVEVYECVYTGWLAGRKGSGLQVYVGAMNGNPVTQEIRIVCFGSGWGNVKFRIIKLISSPSVIQRRL